MFSGIIEHLGIVKNIDKRANQAFITTKIRGGVSDLTQGESIALNGACLTVVNFGKDYFSADVSEETLICTNLGELKSNDVVNLERALKLGERLGGHLVSGHIDGKGRVAKIIKRGQDTLLTISAPENIMNFIIEKGSIAVDGISLTIASCDEKSFTVFIVPYTKNNTNLKYKNIGNTVNLENDMIGKYTKKFVSSQKQGNEIKSHLSKEFLQEHGFM